ncbi:MAG: phosphate ABC transporter ATP-binding protein [Dehalococcoidia bacterium]|nr:phosphate ABC transporter ATP-binding protein [Dehalococcoidia bacterium]
MNSTLTAIQELRTVHDNGEPNQGRINIRNLSVLAEEHALIRDVSLAIPDKQITAIIGPSGSGKTTLLRCINRLVDSSDGLRVSGEIWVDGENVFGPGVDVTAVRKKIGLISQRPSPLPMSIYDNVAYGPKIHGTRRKGQLDCIVQNCLQTTGLWDEVKHRLRAPASKLSIGQQQRLCLARSLAVRPEIILCDEPTSALDPVSAQHIERELIELKNGYTIVLVTHILRQAKRLADYVVFMYGGELVEHGPAQSVFGSPKEARTRSYITGEIS